MACAGAAPLLSVAISMLMPMLCLARGAEVIHIPFPPALHSVPTQFEIAMTETLKVVKEGREPDPAWRKPDGTPGTLLDALLPEDSDPDWKEHQRHMRKLQQKASQWRFFGASIPFSTGPTLSALNSSAYRYASVTPPTYVDWRESQFMTPILAQYNCASCWAVAAADTVAMVTAIATQKKAVAPGVQQICDCSGMLCCQGGWPEDAYSWLVSQGNITTASNYNYWAMDNRNCTLRPNYPTSGALTGWERVPSHSTQELKKAVAMQPVLIYISAGSTDFQQYSSGAPGAKDFKIYGGNCTTEVNHAMVVVGYNTWVSLDGTSTEYWILKNSWPDSGWGHKGFMYLRMTDGVGKCGMQSVNPLYPVYYPMAPTQVTVQAGKNVPVLAKGDLWWKWYAPLVSSRSQTSCTGLIINPCGAGNCTLVNSIPKCACPAPYVEAEGVPTSKCVHPKPCSLGIFNPCGLGICTDVGDGSYFCSCAAGYIVGALVNGAPTCVPYLLSNSKAVTYMTMNGDTCASIQQAYGVSSKQFWALNPYVQCDGLLVPNIAITLPPTSNVMCSQQYVMKDSEKCSSVGYYMQMGATTSMVESSYSTESTSYSTTSTTLQASTVNAMTSVQIVDTSYDSVVTSANPTMDCNRMFKSQAVCVNRNIDTTVQALVCGQIYAATSVDNCKTIKAQFNLNDDIFSRLNPGLSCDSNFPEGLQVCVSSTPIIQVNCSQWYTVQQGDTCALIRNAAGLSQFQLQYMNPGLQCQAPFLYVGRQVCINAPLPVGLQDPNALLYTVAGGDTWAYIQGQFSSKCRPESIAIPKIAEANVNISISVTNNLVVTLANLSSLLDIYPGFNKSAANISDWVNFNISYVLRRSLVIPCVPKIGAMCGCAMSLPVCGCDLVNYASYCDARCNFATPVVYSECTACQQACMGRYGRAPNPTTACASGFVCPWPGWVPPSSDATATFTISPLCSYRAQTCTQSCGIASANGVMTSSTCYNECMVCSRVPCSGPSLNLATNDPSCTKAGNASCSQPGCFSVVSGKTTLCGTDCSFFNLLWSPLNP